MPEHVAPGSPEQPNTIPTPEHPLGKITLQEFNTYLDGLEHMNKTERPELTDEARAQLIKAVEDVRSTVYAHMSRGLSVESALAKMEARNAADAQGNYLSKTRAAQSEILNQLRDDDETLARLREQVADTVQEQLAQTIVEAEAKQADMAADSRAVIDSLPDAPAQAGAGPLPETGAPHSVPETSADSAQEPPPGVLAPGVQLMQRDGGKVFTVAEIRHNSRGGQTVILVDAASGARVNKELGDLQDQLNTPGEAWRLSEPPATPATAEAPRSPEPQPSPETLTPEETVDRVIAAGRGTAVIHTDLAPGVNLREAAGDTKTPRAGLQTFGDGMRSQLDKDTLTLHNQNVRLPDGTYPPDLVESAAFLPVTEDIYEDKVEEIATGLLGRKKQITRRHKVGQRQLQMNGEPAVYFDYSFNTMKVAYKDRDKLGLPKYSEVNGTRDGNHLGLRVMLPESVARQLRQQIESNPALARQMAERIVLEQGGITRETWEQGAMALGRAGYRTNRVKPPYEQMPPGHRLYILEPTPDGDWLQANKLDQPFNEVA